MDSSCSAVTKTQIQAMQLTSFHHARNILLSRLHVPRAAMPEPAQWVGAHSADYFLTVMGVLLSGGAE